MSPTAIPESLIACFEWSLGALQQLFCELLELGAGQLALQMEWALGCGGDEGQIDLGLDDRGHLDLGLLGRLLETLQRHPVLAQVDTVVVLEALDQPVDHLLVPVVTTEIGVTGGGLDLEHTLADLEHRHVEGATAEVEDEDGVI